MKLVKHKVCTSCFSIGITDINCVCMDRNYPTIELEFETCECCNNTLSNYPADTDFNNKQYETLKNESESGKS